MKFCIITKFIVHNIIIVVIWIVCIAVIRDSIWSNIVGIIFVIIDVRIIIIAVAIGNGNASPIQGVATVMSQRFQITHTFKKKIVRIS